MSDLSTLLTRVRANGVARAYEPNQVPLTPSYPYMVGSLAPVPGVQTLDGHRHLGQRFVAQVFSKTSDGIEVISDALDAVFNGKALPLDGSPVAEHELSSQLARDPDDRGVLNITHTYRY